MSEAMAKKVVALLAMSGLLMVLSGVQADVFAASSLLGWASAVLMVVLLFVVGVLIGLVDVESRNAQVVEVS